MAAQMKNLEIVKLLLAHKNIDINIISVLHIYLFMKLGKQYFNDILY